jgi:hypothetical protein
MTNNQTAAEIVTSIEVLPLRFPEGGLSNRAAVIINCGKESLGHTFAAAGELRNHIKELESAYEACWPGGKLAPPTPISPPEKWWIGRSA